MAVYWSLQGQCSSNLVEQAMAQSGKDAIFVREFQVRLQKGTLRNPIPTGKFNVYLKDKTKYRFNITDETNTNGAVLQLFDNGKLVAGTFDEIKSANSAAFDFEATKTGNYQVVISNKEGKPGCIVGILSLVNDQAVDNDNDLKKKDDLEILYLNVENPLSIVTDKEASDSMLVEIDNGSIKEKDGNYFVKPDSEGFATLKVVIKNKNGQVKEEAASEFVVQRLPNISASINGVSGGIITRSQLQTADELEIKYPVDFEKFRFEIVDFSLRIESKGELHIINPGKKFSTATKSKISEIPESTRIIFEMIHVRTPDNKIITVDPLNFIVR
jgi:hypothetical protein